MATSPPQPKSQGDLPAGYRGSRGAVLVELKRAQPVTAKELAARLGMSLNAVRHHLKELEADGLIGFARRHRGVGAPAFAYSLEPAGEALFPRRYEETLAEVLDCVARRDGRAAAVALLETHFDGLRQRLEAELVGASAPERMDAVARALTEAGYMAEGSATFCCGTLSAHNCAIQSVAARFPEICAAEERFLAEVLGGTVERKEHILSGCASCAYRVRFGFGGTGLRAGPSGAGLDSGPNNESESEGV